MLSISKLQIELQNLKKEINDIMSDLLSYFYVKIYLISLFIVNIFIWLMSFFIDSRIDSDQMALHYNVDFGIDYYGNKNLIYIIPVLGIMISLINFCLLATMSRSRDRRFIAHLLLASALICNIILLTAQISVYLINFW